MHDWSDESFDWDGLNDAIRYIAYGLKRWRVPVRDYKEKFGTARIYCSLGWGSFYDIFYPGCVWYKKFWPVRLDHFLSYDTPILRWINKIVCPFHIWLYARYYRKAVEKWPHLREEILSMADHGELFEGRVPGYKHSDYWTTYDDGTK